MPCATMVDSSATTGSPLERACWTLGSIWSLEDFMDDIMRRCTFHKLLDRHISLSIHATLSPKAAEAVDDTTV